MNDPFPPGQVLHEDEFMLCDSLPSSKYIEGQVRMVWPMRGNILRAQLQLKDKSKPRSKYVEMLFHDWPGEYRLKLKDVVSLWLKGAAKIPMLKQGKDHEGKGDEECPFRIIYGHGAILRVQRVDEEFLINYFKEQTNAQLAPVSIRATEDKVESYVDQHRFDLQLNSRSVDPGSPETASTAKRPSPPPKKSKRHKKRHKKNAELKHQGQTEEISPVRNDRESADQYATLNRPDSTLPVEETFFNLPQPYAALGKAVYLSTHSVVGVVTDVGAIKTTKKQEIIKSFILVDPSSIDQGLTINTFVDQQNESLLPSTCYGQILLLRNVYIQKFNGRLQGICFKDRLQWCGYDPSSKRPFYSTVERTAPYNFLPLTDELSYCARLAKWWDTLQNAKHTTSMHNVNITFTHSLTDRRDKLAFISQLQAHKFSDCVVELRKIQDVDERRTDIFVTDYSENEALECFNTSDFPLGKRTLRVTLWEQAKDIAKTLSPGNYYLLKNMKMKSYYFLEGSVGGYGFEGIQKVTPGSPQPNLPELVAQQAYENNPSSSYLRPDLVDATTVAATHDIVTNTIETLIECHDMDSHTSTSSIADVLYNNNSPQKFHLRCRILDYYPRDIKDFIYISCTICGKKLATSNKRCLECGDMTESAALFTYRFILHVIDESGGKLNIRVSGKEADAFLTNLSAKDVVENNTLLVKRLEPLLGHLYRYHDTFVDEDKRDKGPWLNLTIFSYKLDDVVNYKLTGCSLLEIAI